MFTIGILGIVTVLFAIQFKNIKPEYSTYIVLVGCVIIFFYSVSMFYDVVRLMKSIIDKTSISYTHITTILKIMGVTYISEFSSDVAKDCGYGALANQIQIFGKITVLAISVPIFEALIQSIGGLLT